MQFIYSVEKEWMKVTDNALVVLLGNNNPI